MRKSMILKTLCLFLCGVFLFPAFTGCTPQSGGTSAERSSPSSGGPSSSPLPVSGSDDPSDSTQVQPPETNVRGSEELAAMTDIALSRLAGAEGMVLLENNDDALPLQKGEKIAVFGAAQVDFIKGGTGSGDVNALYLVNLLEGLRAKAAEGKIEIYEPLSQKYENSRNYVPTDSDCAKASENATHAIVVLSRNAGENQDSSVASFNLTSSERTLLRRVTTAGFPKVTVLLNVGAVMDTSFFREYEGLDALLVCWQPGMEGGNAAADVLCGDVCPSGKTVDTWASSYGAYPSSKTFFSAAYAEYTEDIFVGYRYFETFDQEYKTVNYPFGYGLSYTKFSFSTPEVRDDGTYVEVSVTVKNDGSVAGKEVAQVYFSAPAGKLGAPGKVLAAFAKTGLLQPGESQTLKMTFAVSDMAMYDDTGILYKNAYVLEKGDYAIYLGNSVRNAGERGIIHTHVEKEDRVVLQLDGRIAPTTLKERLTASGNYETLDTASGYGVVLKEGVTIVSACDYLIQNSQSVNFSNSDGTVYGMSLAAGDALYFAVYAEADAQYEVSFEICMAGRGKTEKGLSVLYEGKTYDADLSGTGGNYTPGKGGSVVLPLKKGRNLLKLVAGSGLRSNLMLCALSFDDKSGKGTTDLRSYTPQSVNIASGETIDFKEVYDDPTKMEAFLNSMTVQEMIHLLCGHAPNVGHGDGSLCGVSAKGVPYLDTSDGPAGLDLSVKQVAWPIETALACTWDVTLLYEVGKKIGEECFVAGVDVWLAPGINIHRDPLGGRNFEYFSEDPLVTGKIASALTQGVQSVKGVGVMIKHLYANSRETGRVDGNSSISERAARMIYLKAFEICIKEAAPLSVMTTYNSTNGVYNSENEALLNGVLREEWGFKGFLCTDWGAHSEQFREIVAGNDAKMSWGYPDSCLAAYKSGVLPLETLRDAARRLLTAALNSGSMERKLHPVIVTHTVAGTTRIKASELSTRSEGIGFEDCTDEDGGVNPNYCQDGRTITYDLDVKKAGDYKMVFRASSDNRSSDLVVYLDNRRVGSFRWSEGSGGWQNWETLESKVKLALKEGKHTLKLEFHTAMNLNWFELVEQ